ncbi:MAG: hypothetical protein BA874_09655 [Desulfuromonadales bacterium C00003068]|jgi:glycosyltransferase involved in cell wall biosynthesis|nr:MAG: hypothetical protein BA874_09655 [Desulfuromonadales bacterium C00003068]
MTALVELWKNLTVFEVAERQHAYPWRPKKKDLPFRLETLIETGFESASLKAQAKGALSKLEEYQPDVVILSGYGHPIMCCVARWARKNNKRSVLLFSTTEFSRKRVWWREGFKKIVLKRLYDFAAVSGAKSAEYMHKLGMPESRIRIIGNVVDNYYLAAKANLIRAHAKESRTRYNLPIDYFLFVGRLSEEKNIPILLDAYKDYKKSGGDWHLLVVGTGPLDQMLRKHVNKIELALEIQFVGWRQLDDLIPYYALGRCLILPSKRETWGLVVNEAMACALPVIVSNRCGCTPELCYSGRNAFIFDPADTRLLASHMVKISSDSDLSRKMGRESLKVIAGHTPRNWAERLLGCIDS